MRLPVSRARYDLAVHNAREMVAQLKTSLAIADARAITAENAHADLLEKYHALRIEGAVLQLPPVVTLPPLLVAREQDELKALISEVCGRDLGKRAMMLRQLAADRADGIADEDIASAIRIGIQSDGVPT